jgi:hypothetical protein
VREPIWGVRGVQSCASGAWRLARGSLRCALGAICCKRGVPGADAVVQVDPRDALRCMHAHWRGVGEALGVERGCWIGVGGAKGGTVRNFVFGAWHDDQGHVCQTSPSRAN